MSPFLFVIAMEGLNNMIKTANMNGWVRGFNVARNGGDTMEITHLPYADDTLLFCDADEEQLRFLRVILVYLKGSLDCISIGVKTSYIQLIRWRTWRV